MSRRENNYLPCLYGCSYDDWPFEDEVTDGFFSRKCDPPKKPDNKCPETKPQAGCKTEKKDPCKSEKKKDPCKPQKKDPCKPQKKDPCKPQKKDPCKPQKKDPCKPQKRDPCPKKPDPCKPAKPDPCKQQKPANPCKSKKLPACGISNEHKKARRCVDKTPRSRNPFIIFFLTLYYKCPNRKVTEVAREAGKEWCRMPEPRKELYKRMAKIEQKKRRRKQKGCRHRKRC